MTSVSASGRQSPNLLAVPRDRPLISRRAALLALAGLTAVAAVLRFARLGHQGIWYDEAFTVMLVRESFGRMLGTIPKTESTPPLYYCVAWVWVRIFGSGAFAVRSVSAIAGTLVVPVAYGVSAELLDSRRAGIICAALVAFNPLLWWYSQEARAYELLVLLSALSLWMFVRVLRQPSWVRVALWAIASMLSLCTHYFAAMLVVPEAVWLLVVHRRRLGVWVGLAFVAACELALLPLLHSQSARKHDAWIAHNPLSFRLDQVVPQLLIGTGAPARDLLKFIALACGALALVLLATAPSSTRRGASVAGGLLLAGVAIVFVAIPFGFDEVLTRNLLELWLPLAICAAGGLATARHRVVGAGATAALCAVGAVAIVGVLTNPALQRPAWPALVRAIGARPPAGESRLIIIQHNRGRQPLAIYLSRFARLQGSPRVSEIDIVAIRGTARDERFCWWGSECNVSPSYLQAHYRLSGFVAVRRFRVGEFHILELRAGQPTHISRAELGRTIVAKRLIKDGLFIQS